MIRYIEGDIFKSPAQVIANPVNTVGVMGKGLALEFKQRYPDMFNKYRSVCEKHQFTIGKLMLVLEQDHWVLLFPTKENWRNPSKLEYIEKGLMKFVNTYADHNICSVAFPRLGCGNGELLWYDVKPLMEKYLKQLPIDIFIYLGSNKDFLPEHKQIAETTDWIKANSKDLSFVGLKDDIMITTSLLPYEFSANNGSVTVNYDKGLCFSLPENENIFVSEDEFYLDWDFIRTESVVEEEETSRGLVCKMLQSMGYLSPVRIIDDKAGTVANGYQVNEGAGRRYSLEGGRS